MANWRCGIIFKSNEWGHPRKVAFVCHRTYKIFFCTIIFCIVFTTAKTQTNIQKVPGLPTREIYDLHVDRKGYLWIAHGLGISRYDGLNFIHFTSPLLTDLRMSDIVEDPHERIWFHNFSGQILYIAQGKLNFLTSYNYKKENQSPKMALCGDELLVTSGSGLFVCSTTTLQSKYIALEKATGTSVVSLAVIGDKAIIFNQKDWFVYEKGTGAKKLGAALSIHLQKGNTATLQTISYHDTIFLITNPAGTLQKLVLQGNKLECVGTVQYHDYINSVTGEAQVWVNARNNSQTLDGAHAIKDYNLTDIVRGKEGNTWYGSIKNGLLVSFHAPRWHKIKFPIGEEDFVRSLNIHDGYFFAGTQKGYLLVMSEDGGPVLWKHNMFNGYGSIDFIRFFRDHRFIVGTSTNTYVANPKQKKIETELPIKSIADIDFDENSAYAATSTGFWALPFSDSTLNSVHSPFMLSPQRSGAVRFDKTDQSVFVSTKNGLQHTTKNGIRSFLINGKEVYASSLGYKDGRLYIATIGNGLWIKENDSLRHFNTTNDLFSNTIVHTKLVRNHLWLFENSGIQIFDTEKCRILNYIELPKIGGADVFDVDEKNGYAYLATADGLYKIPMKVQVEKKMPVGYLEYVVADNRDTLLKDKTNLAHDMNDIQFFFSSPAYYDPQAVSFKYRLVGDDNDWQTTKPNERMLRFSSLPPGSYTFEAVAVNKNGLQQDHPIRFHFTILKSWWTTWWFIVLVNALIIATVLLIIRNRIDQRLKVELIRRGIASDLHDDIGATLSSVTIYTEMVREELGESQYLDHIKENISNTITRLDDLVWSINPKNDTMEQLLNRMQHTSRMLLETTGVKCHFSYDPKILDMKLNLANKRNVYLLFKEMINNVVKHAQCRNCFISLEYHQSDLTLAVRDDGIGFEPEIESKGRNGIESMRYRARRMNGSMHIDSSHTAGSSVVVRLKTS